jgi:xylan 1,4-beta-xylosidase
LRLLAKVDGDNTKRILQDTVLRFVAMMKRWHGSLSILLLCAGGAFSQSTAVSGSRSLHVDAGKVTGEIRSFQGLNGLPSPVMAGLPNLVQQYKDLRVNQVRTHDFMGPTEIDSRFEQTNPLLAWLIPDDTQRAGVVRAGNASTIFPDWSADPEKAESYRFGPSDQVIAAIVASGAEVYYRIGRSWGANIEAPPDFDKYASVVKHIAMHYNLGWANGFHDNIRYWEFWNEPEVLFWGGTPEQFYSLYEKTARALKSVDPALRVGGVAKAFAYDNGPYREGFIDYCVAHKVPLDFYSWHTYADGTADPYDAVRLSKKIREVLNARGLSNTESILSEWNLTPDFTVSEKSRLQGEENAAFVGAVLSYFQDAPIDHAHFYRGDAAWMGLFGLDGKHFKTAYTFEAMGKMLDTPQRFAVEGTDTFGFTALAGRSADGKTVQILISNYAIPAGFQPHIMPMPPDVLKTIPPTFDFSKLPSLPRRTDIVYHDNSGYSLSIDHLPWGKKAYSAKRYRISKTQNLDLVEENSGSGGSFSLSNTLAPDAVELIVLQGR